jgi:3-hydroxybutyryl-CoA dehydrogenase
MSDLRAVVIGTGSMGPEIAAAFAMAGLETQIAGRTTMGRDAAAARATELAGGAPITPAPIDEPTFADIDLVVETIVEDLATKHALLTRVEPWCHPKAIIATNTSSLTIADIVRPLAHPRRFAGLHFLKPGHLTGVVEIIPGPGTNRQTIDFLRDVAHQMDKAPLVAQRDVPGFIWNRIQFAVLRECLHMLETGVASAADIDAAMSDGLAPRWTAAGPLATADLGGLRTFAGICDLLFPHLAAGDTAPEVIREAAQAGRPLQPWVTRDVDAVAALRTDALASGRILADRRRRLATEDP